MIQSRSRSQHFDHRSGDHHAVQKGWKAKEWEEEKTVAEIYDHENRFLRIHKIHAFVLDMTSSSDT